jgi:hypothetical protein
MIETLTLFALGLVIGSLLPMVVVLCPRSR